MTQNTPMEELRDSASPLMTFGTLVREERVRRGYTVDEVASQLKITSRMVRAIEDGDMESMPHAVYARGFIRSYARLLGIEEQEVQAVCAFLKNINEEPTVQEPRRQLTSSQHTSPHTSSSGKAKLLIILLLAAALVGGSVWYLKDNMSLDAVKEWLPQQAAQDAAPKMAEPLVIEPETLSLPNEASPDAGADNKTSPVPPVVTPTETTQLPAGSAVGQESTPIATNPVQPSAPQPTPAAESSVPAESSSTTPASSNGSLTLQTGSGNPTQLNTVRQRHQIILTALAECWIHSTADGTETRQLSIRKGEVFALSFDQKLVIKLGNAGGVRIKYDGEELPPPGKMGQVKTITFPPDAAN